MRHQSLNRPEHVFDFVALLIEEGVIRDRDLAIAFRGDAGGDAALCEGGAEPIGVSLSARSFLAFGMAGNISAAPFSSLICPSANPRCLSSTGGSTATAA